MNHLVYFSYGHGPHEMEARYSILSARQALARSGGDVRILLYTDDPRARPGDDVALRLVQPEELLAWTGPHGFHHRRKLSVLRDALKTLPGPVVLIDSDTYFRQSPLRLFDRIAPGRSLLHRREGHLDKWNATPFADHLAARTPPVSRDGTPWDCTADTPMWNSGIIGMHPQDVALVDEMLFLLDQILEPVRFHGAEQFAAGVVLMQRTRLAECLDIVFHYWLMERRLPFRAAMQQAFAQETSPEGIHRTLKPLQPVEPAVELAKLRVKRLLEATGLYKERRRS